MSNEGVNLKYLIFIMFSLGLFFLEPAFAQDPPLPTPVGRVVWVKGVLTAVMPNNEQRTLQKTSVIYLKDTLLTDKNTQAQIIFSDNTMMTFRPETRFYIDQFKFNPEAKKGSMGQYVMRLIEGGFRTITGLIGKDNPKNYQVNTPVATIGVRGTDYTVFVHNGELYIAFYSGIPCVKNDKGQLCLDKYNRYLKVDGDSAPEYLGDEPWMFKDKLEITPSSISPFSKTARSTSGVISSFCITQ